jgi:hypothetical protein
MNAFEYALFISGYRRNGLFLVAQLQSLFNVVVARRAGALPPGTLLFVLFIIRGRRRTAPPESYVLKW